MSRFILPLLFTLTLCTRGSAQNTVSAELIESSQVALDGLYFTGERNVGYRFGRRITPHGDCIDVVNGYQFVTWYNARHRPSR